MLLLSSFLSHTFGATSKSSFWHLHFAIHIFYKWISNTIQLAIFVFIYRMVWYLVFKVKFEFKFIWLCVGNFTFNGLIWLVFSSALINSNAIDVTMPKSLSAKWSERRRRRKYKHTIYDDSPITSLLESSSSALSIW